MPTAFTEPILSAGGHGGGPDDLHPGGDGGGGDGHERWKPGLYRTAMWCAVIAVTTLFAALAFAYVIRSANKEFWQPVRIPRILIGSTLVLLFSSITCEAARRTLHRSYLIATLSLGCVFLAMQVAAWRDLMTQGAFVDANPHSTFFYLFTGVHGIHLLVGIAMLWYMLLHALLPSFREMHQAQVRELAGAAALYWHVMDGLWLGLFLLLWFRG